MCVCKKSVLYTYAFTRTHGIYCEIVANWYRPEPKTIRIDMA